MAKCFVIQPVDRGKFDRRYKDTFKPAIEEAGYEPYRADEDPSVSIPIEQIEKSIREAEVCFAEITTDNANVWYELGYAFALRKPVIMVCESNVRQKFPFDVQHRTITLYDSASASDFETLKTKIIARLKATDKTGIAVSEFSTPNQKHEIELRFVAEPLRCYWSIGKPSDQPIVHIVTHWHVTNVPGSRTSAKLLEPRLLEPQGRIIQAAIFPSRTSPRQVYREEIPEGDTVKFTISFVVISIAEPKGETLEVRIVVIDQLAKQHELPPITLKRYGP